MAVSENKILVKRIFETWFILLVSIAVIPIFLVISILVYLNLGWPLFYNARRMGRNHKIFKLYKFRSMTNEKDQYGELLPDEKRHTPFGRLLRRTSLDELPQLINILIGNMALIGPRPILPKQINLVPKKYLNRFEVRPGMTSLTSIEFKGGWKSWDEKMRLDSKYVSDYSLMLDLKIFIKTFWILILRFFVNNTGTSAGEDEIIKLQQMNDAKMMKNEDNI